ncbi:formate transporter FocA [Ferrimonas senticii]|uniref:formate transporter FocA n=1 Tax=Ferrimonas senticii TaxID=394566 RepID=UPI000417160B|nr:formate transporter FocA [Ferrimonas senticii]
MSTVTSVKSEPNQTHLTPPQMMAVAETFAVGKTSKPTAMTILSAAMGGLFIGLAFVFYITVTTGNGDIGWGVNKLIGGVVFSLGLILVVVAGAELFTSTVLSLISYVRGETPLGKMLGVWGKVYLGNFIGAILLVALVMAAQLYINGNGAWGLNALKIAQHKLHHEPLQAFALGILCNLMVCLAVWLTFSAKSNGAKAFLMVMPVALFVSSGFEHCIANLFMVPLGIAIASTAEPSFWAMVGADPAAFADLTWSNFLFANLIPVTLGNIVGGGVVVGLGYHTIYRTFAPAAKVAVVSKESVQQEASVRIDDRLVSEVMNREPLLLSPSLSLNDAMHALQNAGVTGAPVVDQQQQLLGYLSHHDVLVEMWCRNFDNDDHLTVAQVMQTDVQRLNASDSVLKLAQYLSVDEKELFPVTSSGIATSMTTASLAERAKQQRIARPQMLPVMINNRVVGTISKNQIASHLFAWTNPEQAKTLDLVKSA